MHASKLGLVTTLALFACAPPADKEQASRETASEPPRETASEAPTETSNALPGVSEFFAAHPKYGSIREVKPMPDWAQGARQQVVTDMGAYLVYLKGDTVVTLYANDASGRRELWRKPGS
jgi:hypothetical protein